MSAITKQRKSAPRPLCELLSKDVGVQPHECLNDAFGRLVCRGEHHADALSPLQELDHQRCAADYLDQLLNIVGLVGESGYR